ncbi:unnamed protein product [Arctogadus glacialis]
MAAKKKEVSLQTSITIQEQWDEMLATKGLTVIDVYQQWCGPCKAVVSLLRKIKNELGEDLLHFATAEADSMEALEKYRGRCEPTFLFFGGGQLVGVLRGANAPLLQRRVLEELAKEKLVMEQGGERRTVEDDGLVEEEEEEEEHGDGIKLLHDESMLVPPSEGFTLAILKPDAVATGNAEEIITKIRDAGFQILAQEERALGEQVVQELYRPQEAEPYFEELVRFMSSGPSHILVLSRAGPGPANVVQAWLDFMGPTDVEEAKRDKPHSLRARYGTRTPLNAVHGSADRLQAGRELALLLPHFSLAGAGQEGRGERTLALLRPPAARDRREELLSRVGAACFRVALRRELTMTEDQVRLFYRHHADEEPYPALQISMTSGPVLALVLVRDHAIQTWRALLGPADLTQARKEDPNCLRALFAVETEPLNQLHGSASADEAQREIDLLFPVQRTLALITPGALQQHREEILEDVRAAGFSVVREKEAVLSREEAEDWYKEQRGQPAFTPLLEVLCGGPCLLLVLTKENAVEEWMALMGPLDPVEARESAPGSLRARFSSDLIHTAVHGSSSEQHAEEHILRLLGDLSSDPGLSGPADPPGEAEEPVTEGSVSGSGAEVPPSGAPDQQCAEGHPSGTPDQQCAQGPPSGAPDQQGAEGPPSGAPDQQCAEGHPSGAPDQHGAKGGHVPGSGPPPGPPNQQGAEGPAQQETGDEPGVHEAQQQNQEQCFNS